MDWSKTAKVIASTVIFWASVEVLYFVWYITKEKTKKDNSDSVDLPVAKPEVSGKLEVSHFSETAVFFDGNLKCYDSPHDADQCENVNCFRRNMSVVYDHLRKPERSVDVCIDHLNSSPLIPYLHGAIKLGVDVRILHLPSTSDTEISMALQGNGALVRSKRVKFVDSPIREMYHNFVVIDKKYLITGSLRWKNHIFTSSWEDLVFLSDQMTVHTFLKEFDFLWNNFNVSETVLPPYNDNTFPFNMSFWKNKPYYDVFMFRKCRVDCRPHMNKKGYQQVEQTDDRHTIACLYPVLSGVCQLINTAEKSIDVCMVFLNFGELADTFVDGFSRGLQVRMVGDVTAAGMKGSQVMRLLQEGIEFRSKNRLAYLHHNFIVVDRKLVLFGSFQWTLAAMCNSYGNLICTNKEVIAKTFSDNFDIMWSEFLPVDWKELEERM